VTQEIAALKLLVADAVSNAAIARAEVGALVQANVARAPVNFHEHSFSGYPEFLQFAAKHKIELGCTGDAFVLLHGCSGVVTSREATKDKKTAKDGDFGTPLQSLVAASFSTTVPEGFSPHKGAGDQSSNATKDVLKRSAKTFSGWEDDTLSSGLRFQLAKSVKSVKERVAIASRAGKMTGTGREFCVSLTADSVAESGCGGI
jgi:hypothetical protein